MTTLKITTKKLDDDNDGDGDDKGDDENDDFVDDRECECCSLRVRTKPGNNQ